MDVDDEGVARPYQVGRNFSWKLGEGSGAITEKGGEILLIIVKGRGRKEKGEKVNGEIVEKWIDGKGKGGRK